MTTKILPIKIYVRIWAILMALLAATWGCAQLNLQPFNVIIALTIAFTKMVLIILYFMHVRVSTRLTWLFVGAGFFWLGILFLLGMADYISRGWLLPPG